MVKKSHFPGVFPGPEYSENNVQITFGKTDKIETVLNDLNKFEDITFENLQMSVGNFDVYFKADGIEKVGK